MYMQTKCRLNPECKGKGLLGLAVFFFGFYGFFDAFPESFRVRFFPVPTQPRHSFLEVGGVFGADFSANRAVNSGYFAGHPFSPPTSVSREDLVLGKNASPETALS